MAGRAIRNLVFVVVGIILAVVVVCGSRADAKGPDEVAALRKEIAELKKQIKKIEKRQGDHRLWITQRRGDANENRDAIQKVDERLTNFIKIFVPNGKWKGRIPWHTHVDQQLWLIDHRLRKGVYRFSEIEARLKALEAKK